MPDLDDYAHLWDGSEPGWTLRSTQQRTWRIRFVFSDSKPTMSEVRTLRQLLPGLRALPAREAVKRLSAAPYYDLPEPTSNIEMRSLVDRAKALGLVVEATVEDHSWELPVRGGSVLLIEDDTTARRVCERMRAAGVPVEHIEVD